MAKKKRHRTVGRVAREIGHKGDHHGVIDLTKGGNPLLPRPAGIDSFLEHNSNYVKRWNKDLATSSNSHLRSLRMNNKDMNCKGSKRMLLNDGQIADYLRGDTTGQIYPNQITTTVEIAEQILDHPGMAGVCVGATMCGKTGTACNCQWLAPMIWNATGKPAVVVTLLPNRKSIEAQARNSLKRFFRFYGDCELTNGNPYTLNEYHSHILSAIPGAAQILANEDLGDIHKNWKSPVMRRSHGRNRHRIEAICEWAKKNSVRLIFVVDEPHWGAGIKSEQWNMLSLADKILSRNTGLLCGGVFSLPL